MYKIEFLVVFAAVFYVCPAGLEGFKITTTRNLKPFIALMYPNQPFGIFAVGTSLPPETSGVGSIIDWESFFV